jgi:uncharacterized protein
LSPDVGSPIWGYNYLVSPTGVVRHDIAASRYEYLRDGQAVAVADYRSGPGFVVMHHTYTEPAHRGHGAAARLVAGVLDDLRVRGLRVVATCWYVQQFIDDHPEYRDLLHDHSQKPDATGITE